MTELKLIALDEEDLKVVSAHLQDAVIRLGDMTYLPKERRFAALLNRFDWSAAAGSGILKARRNKPFQRRRAALRFERVLSARIQGLDLKAASQVVSLLAIQFEPAAPPGGAVTLIFAGGPAIRLEVECIEAELKDLGGAWRTRSKPDHDDGGAQSG